VKEPLTALDEISVPTSVNTSDTEEMSVKLPLGPSTSAAQELNQKHEGNVVDPDVILKIKEVCVACVLCLFSDECVFVAESF